MASVVWWSVHTLCRTLSHTSSIYYIYMCPEFVQEHLHTHTNTNYDSSYLILYLIPIAVNICDSNHMQLSIVRALNQ